MNEKVRLGRFKVTRELLHDWRTLLPAFSQMVVVQTHFNYATDVVEYTAYSDLFEEIDRHTVPPLYEFEFQRTLSGEIMVSCKQTKDESERL